MLHDHRTYIVLISFDVLIDGANSLKVKRSVVNRIKDRVRARFNASVAEIGYLDKWQRAALGIVMISNEKQKLQKDVDTLQAMLAGLTDMSINDFSVEWL
ncbi:MAG: DUF503 domain-containing protein [Gammaproteobacteria bacterium]|nr:DUF503 domain-containing protein [Gammaproteobacteria bacterium]